MNKDMLRQGTNVVAVIVTLAINGLANALPINGQTTGQISDRFAVYFACGLCILHLGPNLSGFAGLCHLSSCTRLGINF